MCVCVCASVDTTNPVVVRKFKFNLIKAIVTQVNMSGTLCLFVDYLNTLWIKHNPLLYIEIQPDIHPQSGGGIKKIDPKEHQCVQDIKYGCPY